MHLRQKSSGTRYESIDPCDTLLIPESLINNRKSGRWMSRMAEYQILNGHYDVAEKYLYHDYSLFYRKWAENERQYLRNDAAIASNPIYAYLRSVRNQSDFLYYYPEMDKGHLRSFITRAEQQ